MSPTNKKNRTEELTWVEQIRKRPGMYLGSTDIRGFVHFLKDIYTQAIHNLNATTLFFECSAKNKGVIHIQHQLTGVVDNWSKLELHPHKNNQLGFQVINALSGCFKIELLDEKNQVLHQQTFSKGNLKDGKPITAPFLCAQIKVWFELDPQIWGDEFRWRDGFMRNQLSEFSYLYKKIKFKLAYTVENEKCNVIYFSKNGLLDLLAIEQIQGLNQPFLTTHIETEINGMYIEMAFAFTTYSVDKPFIKSFVNDEYTCQNGTHVDALISGLKRGVTTYAKKHQLTLLANLSEDEIKENLLALINIRMDFPNFAGSVKNELLNVEIKTPISTYIADLLLQKIEADNKLAEKLMQML